MSGIIRFVYRLVDRIAELPSGTSSAMRARSRALIIWTLVSIPSGGILIFASQDLTLTSPTSLGLLVGIFGMLSSIHHLRVTKKVDQASLIFVFSALIGLGAGAWFVHEPTLVPLIFLAVTPVYFGLIANWTQCLKYTLSLFAYFVLLALWVGFNGGGGTDLTMNLHACALAALGGGFSTTAYSYTVSRATKKLMRQRDEIVSLAFNDTLTGSLNRRAFNDALSQAQPAGSSPYIAMIDLDKFKSINERYGHEVGDEVLVELVLRMKAATPENAKMYRVGGDEFGIIAHGDRDAAQRTAQDICASFQATFSTTAGYVPIKVSVGVSSCDSPDPDLKKIFFEANTALVEAKKHPGSHWAEYCDTLGERKRRGTRLSELLKSDIQSGSIGIAFQPQFEIKHNSVIGFEALARWNTDEFGAISPGEFIAIANEGGLINGLDRAIFQKAVSSVAGWLTTDQKIAINVSGKTLLSVDFVEYVQHVISGSSLRYNQLQIEITETEIIENKADAQATCDKLRRLGISIALDDFGTGYSSLSYLSSLPINMLKVDKSFVQACHRESNLKIIKSIVGLAQSLGMDLMIEGVERDWQLETIKKLGCHNVQGFYFSRPLTAEKCLELMTRQNASPASTIDPAIARTQNAAARSA